MRRMLRQTFILFSATVWSSLAESEFYRGNSQNYNINNNRNEIYGGYGSGSEVENVGDRDLRRPRYPPAGSGNGGLGSGLPEYVVVGSGSGSPGQKLPKYLPTGSGGTGHKLPKYHPTETGGLGDDLIKYPGIGVIKPNLPRYRPAETGGLGDNLIKNPASEREAMVDKLPSSSNNYGRGSCSGILDSLFRDYDNEQAVIDEATDDDGSPQGSVNYNSNYNVVFKDSTRRHLGYRPRDGSSGFLGGNNVNGNVNSNSIGPKYRRSNTWITRPSSGRVRGYDRQSRGYAKRYEHDRDKLLYDRTELDYDRDDEENNRGLRGTNVNSNANYNVLGGRRGNVNYNINSNDFGYGGNDESHENERSERTPYSDYGKARSGRNGYETQENDDDYTPSRYSGIGYTRRPPNDAYGDGDDSEDEDEDQLQDEGSTQNRNVNSNSNMNIFSRRSNRNSRANNNSFLRRNKRSVENLRHVLESIDNKRNPKDSIPSKTKSTTASKPIAEKWEDPRSSIYDELM